MKTFEELEKEEMKTFDELHPYIDETNDFLEMNNFLYHGIRFQKNLEILESIFKDGKILAGKHIPDFPEHRFFDNCNDGEYVSLLECDDSRPQLEWQTFIKPNVTLVISPKCGAKKTIYVPTYQWDDIKKNHPQTKNRYSYMRGEYQVKDYIPLSLVVAIGVPHMYLIDTKSHEFANQYLKDVISLMKEYRVYKPIVDTSFLNMTLEEITDPLTIPRLKQVAPGLTPKRIKDERPGFKVYTKQYMKHDNRRYKK